MEAQCKKARSSVRAYHGDDDYDKALDHLSYFAGDRKELEAYLNYLQLRCRNLIGRDSHWRAVERLAEALLKRKAISGPTADRIIKNAVAEQFGTIAVSGTSP